MPKLGAKLGIKFVAGPYVLGSEHESQAVVETDKIETIDTFMLQSGMAQWNSVRVSTARGTQEALEELKTLPPSIH